MMRGARGLLVSGLFLGCITLSGCATHSEEAHRDDAGVREVSALPVITRDFAPRLAALSGRSLSASFADVPLWTVFEHLQARLDISVMYDDSLDLQRRVHLQLDEVSAQSALDELMSQERLTYKQYDERTILVLPDTPRMREEHARFPPAPGALRDDSRFVDIIDVELHGIPLRAALEDLAGRQPFRFDLGPGVDGDELTTFVVVSVSVAEALDLLLLQHGLAYDMLDDGSLLIHEWSGREYADVDGWNGSRRRVPPRRP